jgi:hypothetical protein
VKTTQVSAGFVTLPGFNGVSAVYGGTGAGPCMDFCENRLSGGFGCLLACGHGQRGQGDPGAPGARVALTVPPLGNTGRTN